MSLKIFLARFDFHKILNKGLKYTVGTPFHNADRGSPFFCQSCMVGHSMICRPYGSFCQIWLFFPFCIHTLPPNVFQGTYPISSETCIYEEYKKCSFVQKQKATGVATAKDTVHIISRGSPPEDLTHWAQDDDFNPVPIHMDLSPFCDLVMEGGGKNVKQSGAYGFQRDLNATGIAKLLKQNAPLSCELLMGRSRDRCMVENSGCGINDNCKIGDACQPSDEAPGFKCKAGAWYLISIWV